MNFNSVSVEKYIETLLASTSLQIALLTTLLLKKGRNKERNTNERRRNAHCDTMKSITFSLYTTYNCLLYTVVQRFMCAVVFLFSIFAALLFTFATTVNVRS